MCEKKPFLVQKSDTKVPEKRSSLLCYELVLRSQEVFLKKYTFVRKDAYFIECVVLLRIHAD